MYDDLLNKQNFVICNFTVFEYDQLTVKIHNLAYLWLKVITVLLKGNVANARNFFAIYECILSMCTSLDFRILEAKTNIAKEVVPQDAST